MSLFTITDFLSAAVCCLLAAVVLAANPRRAATLSFAVSMTLTAALAIGLGMLELSLEQKRDPVFWARWSFASLSLLGAPWLFFSTVFATDGWQEARGRRAWIVALAAVGGGVLAFQVATAPIDAGRSSETRGTFALGAVGTYFHVFLLSVSIAVLAAIERTFRAAHEFQRWKVKHILFGLLLMFGFFTFYAAMVLITKKADFRFLRLSALAVLAGSACMAISIYRDRSLEVQFKVSHRLAYRSIAFTATGIFLIFMAAVARSVGSSTKSAYVEAVVAFGAILVFSLLFLSSSFRLRARRWIQRNLFRSSYDYRDLWLRASERLRSGPTSESLKEMAGKLAELLQDAMGVKDVSTWIRVEGKDQEELQLLGARGFPPAQTSILAAGPFLQATERSREPFEADAFLAGDTGPEALATGREIFTQTRAVLCAPLRSGQELVGILTVGQRVDGSPLQAEDRECLRAVGGHVASQIHNTLLLTRLVTAKEAEAFRTLSTFLIHDLKNFTSTLTLIAQNAAHHRGNPQFLQDAFDSVSRIAGTMNRLCGSLRTVAGGLQISPRPGDVDLLIGEMIRGIEVPAGIQVLPRLDGPPAFRFDPEAVRTILTNLLLNAREAMAGGGKITVTTGREDGWAVVAVEDEGAGIPREFLDKELFVPFRTTKSGGTGIGLFQTKSLVEAHGGRIQVESEVGKGTLVRVFFPLGDKPQRGPSPVLAGPPSKEE